MTPEERLTGHVDRLNASVRTGHFGAYANLFAEDGRLKILGNVQHAGAGVYQGHGEIAAACARWFWADTLRIVSVIAATEDSVTFDYARGGTPNDVGGQIILKWRRGRLQLMTVTVQ